MESKVAKIKNSILRSSGFIIARKMATKTEVKYLTEKQAQQLKRYGIYPEYLSSSERKEVNSLIKQKMEEARLKKELLKGLRIGKFRVTFEDEEGTRTADFPSLDSATDWIEFQESQRAVGEKFNHISTEKLPPRSYKRLQK